MEKGSTSKKNRYNFETVTRKEVTIVISKNQPFPLFP